MTQLNTAGQRVMPYAGYKFRIKEIGGDYMFAVNKVSALSRSVEVMEYREGGDPSLMRKSPGQAKYEAITLERGVTNNTQWEEWANKVWTYGAGLGGEVSLADFRKDLQLEIMNEAGQIVLVYKIYRCWVSEWRAFPDADAGSSSFAIQSVKLENEGWERDDQVEVPAEPRLGAAAR
ncbi:phage tail protein [Paracoccus sp. MBLB3053]|uniref:Phage tail protein n=1 Tax=Paracoccus aurantius TaxID=3073814 RepID=A0ABU2HYL8_9RHOB|nr:phage tail protein [Paracoccus sp. MBLB3053]MDS9470140.1 phage tail protein [Paracoccus sp. MBLB3053]